MRSLGRFAARLALVLAWLFTLLGISLLVLEKSGLFASGLRTALAWRLGPIGEGLEIGAVELKWFEPGIVISDVRLEAVDETRGRARTRPLLLSLSRVHFSLTPDFQQRTLRQLHVDGGKVRISNELIEGLNRFAQTLGASGGGGSPPPFVLTDFQIDVELPEEGEVLRVGTVNLIARQEEHGYTLRGALTPDLGGAFGGRSAIQVVGSQIGEGIFELRATAEDLPLESSALELPPSLGPLPVEAYEGRLSLEARGRVELSETFSAEGDLRARLFDARLLPRPGDPWVEELEVDVDADVVLAGMQDLWARDAWNTVLRARADWRSVEDPTIATPVEVWGLFGKRAPAGAWARSFTRVPRVPMTRSALLALGAREDMDDLWRIWDALTLDGFADVTVDSIVHRVSLGDGSYDYQLRSALHARLAGEAGITFQGFETKDPRALPGDRLGFDVRCGEIQGDVFFTFDQTRPSSWWVAIPGLQGLHPTGTAQAFGTLSERTVGSLLLGPHLDLDIEVDDVRLEGPGGAAWARALQGSFLTRQIWNDYNPGAGLWSTRWRLRDAPDTGGLSAQGSVSVQGGRMAWKELPIPVTPADGRLELRWAATPAPLDLGGRMPVGRERFGYRPFGIAWDLSNLAAGNARGAEARVRGMYREDPAPSIMPRDFDLDDVRRGTWWLDVDMRKLGLKGADAGQLAEFAEAFGALREDLDPVGRIQAHYESSQALPTSPYLASIEARPLDVGITPKQFRRRASDLSGRVLIDLAFSGEELQDVQSAARAALFARWPQDVALAATMELLEDGRTELHVIAAGPDPDDPGLRGAFADALAQDEEDPVEVDLSQTALTGALDLELRSSFVVPETEPGQDRESVEIDADNRFRIFLRDCSLSNESVRLDGLLGVLEATEDVLRARAIQAELAGHPILLEDVLMFPVERAGEIPEVDPLLLRQGFVTDSTGTATQARVRTRDLPLDEEHLANLVNEETLAALRDSQSWRGLLDIEGARVLITSPEGAEGIVVLSGPLRPHDLAVSFGLPIEVERANVDVREMVLERGSVRAWAEIEGLNATLAERDLRDASMIVALVDQRLSIDDLDGAFVGGRLRSLGSTGRGSRKAVGVDLKAPHRFDIALAMEDVQVDRLLRGVFQSSIADEGLLRAQLQLAGTPDDLLGLHGRGSMRLTEGRLWSIPAVRALFAQLGFEKTAVFDHFDTRFEIRDGVIDTHHVLVKSALMKLFGDGTLDLDGSLRYDLDVRYSLLDRLGFLNRLIYWLNRSLIRVAIRGDFGRPRILIRSSLLELLGGRPDDQGQGLPLPDFAPLPARF